MLCIFVLLKGFSISFTTAQPFRYSMTRSKVFFCYNHHDEAELKALLSAFIPLIGEGNLVTWDDARVLYNEDWEDEMADGFDAAEVVVLLLGMEFLEADREARDLFMDYIREVEDEGVYVLPWHTASQPENAVLPFVMNNPLDQASVSLDTPENQDAAPGRMEAFARLIHGLREARRSQQQPDLAAPSTPESLKQLADHLKAQGYPKEAEALYLRIWTRRKDEVGDDHPDTTASMQDLVLLYEEQEVYKKAEPILEQLLALFRKKHGNSSEETAQVLNDLGGIYLGLERYRDARRVCQEALQIREKVLGKDHPKTAESLHNQGVIYETLDLIDRALPSYERALAIRETTLGEEHQDTMTTIHRLAVLYEEEGLDDKADVMYQRMYEVFGDDEEHEDL